MAPCLRYSTSWRFTEGATCFVAQTGYIANEMDAIAGRHPGGRPLRRRREMVLMQATGGCEGPQPSNRPRSLTVDTNNRLGMRPPDCLQFSPVISNSLRLKRQFLRRTGLPCAAAQRTDSPLLEVFALHGGLDVVLGHRSTVSQRQERRMQDGVADLSAGEPAARGDFLQKR
jgi:hypothetical protein